MYEDYLERFIHSLTESEDSLVASQKAFGLIAEYYHIRRVWMQFATPDSPYTKGGESKNVTLFEAGGDIQEEPGYQKEFQTGEGGTVAFFLYCEGGAAAFSEEEQRELDTFLEALFLHCGRWRLINRVKKITHTDRLTGLPNSEGFIECAEELFRKKELTRYNAYYFNLTRFSLVNKRFGSGETDVIIARYSQELTKFLKEGECIGRLGGDNFVALILKERTDEFLARLAGVETYGMMGSRKVPVKISAAAGVFEIDDSVVHCGRIIGECATALNIAKHIEKKPYVFASEEIRQRMFKERQVASGFEESIRRHEFKAYYQPKVETDSYRIVGAEALARLEHEGKLVPPMEFVPVLEQNGMICVLDFYILEQVCKDIREWLQMGIEPVRISVNLSRRHLANPNLAEDIMSILGKYELESKYIELELTETVDETESAQIINFMRRMKKYDIALSIDDFGTGYSSLNLLRSFPVDVLKLDKTFLDSLEENDRIVLSNIIRMASELHMAVVAEGVENWDQVDYLKEMSCKIVQGFLFDKPMPKSEFEGKLKEGKYALEA